MTRLLKATSLVIAFFLTACSISEFGAPPLNQEDRWSRAGYTKSQIRSALSMCGQDEPWSIKNMEKVDWCMLKQGYIFIDSPYRSVHKRCDGYAQKSSVLPFSTRRAIFSRKSDSINAAAIGSRITAFQNRTSANDSSAKPF